jgi:tRNA U34 2-thiouridine synthase MnmA/TrmU
MLTVTNKIEEIEILGKEIRLKGVNWTGKEPKMLSRIFLRTRYRNPLVCGIIKKYSQSDSADKEYLIILEKPQRAVTPGQFAVFYSKKGEVSGGGTIV